MRIQVDEAGRLQLPLEIAERYGLLPGASAEIEEEAAGLRMRRPTTNLAKLYIEPTNSCNLACRTCVRNAWDEPLGMMREETFEAILRGVRLLPAPPTVFFGGFGEPTSHPRIAEMVTAAKGLGSRVELITNGTLLTEGLARSLIAGGLDRLWVSLDGARPESYTDVRLGATLPQVIANLSKFRDLRPKRFPAMPEIGIAFVAMRRNVSELPGVLSLGSRLGATYFMVSNVLPHSEAMRKETLYERTVSWVSDRPSAWSPAVMLPRIDVSRATGEPLLQVLQGTGRITIGGIHAGGVKDRCPFIEAGAAAVGWDGSFSPCLPLLHSHTSLLHDRARFSRRYAVGRVDEMELLDIWRDPSHLAFRERVRAFDFSPCALCGGCQLSEGNEEDCFGNEFPTCGGCLWAQGVVQCP